MDSVPIRIKTRFRSISIRPNKELLLPLLMIAFLTLNSILVMNPRVTLIVEGETVYQGTTGANTVGELLVNQGIDPGPWDVVSPHLWAPLSNNMQVSYRRGVPVKVAVAGREQWISAAQGESAQAMLKRSGIEINPLDRIATVSGSETKQVVVTRVEHSYHQRLRDIDFSTREIPNEDLPEGEKIVLQRGEAGLLQEKWQVTYEDGEQTEARVLESKVLKEPVEEIVEVGTGRYVMTAAGSLAAYTKELQVTATAYCAGTPGTGCPIDERGWSTCTGPYNSGYTATGAKAVPGDGTLARPHMVAVDPSIIPLGRLLYIEGLGYARAADVGGAIKQNRIDLLMSTHSQALRFGRRSLVVYVLKEI